MILLTAHNKSGEGALVPGDERNSSPLATRAPSAAATHHRREDDPYLDGMLLDLTAESTIDLGPPEPKIVDPTGQFARMEVAPDLSAVEAEADEAGAGVRAEAPRGRRRIPVLGLSIFALMVAGGAAYSSLRMPIGDATSAAPPAAAEPSQPAAEIVTATLAVAEPDKEQARLPEAEWPAPPPLAPVPGAVSAAALPPAPLAGAPSPAEAAGSLTGPSGGAIGAVARTAVNMRSGPDRSSPVVSVVAAGTPVEVRSCDFWCDVVVAGEAGWIYQDYLDGPIDRRVQ